MLHFLLRRHPTPQLQTYHRGNPGSTESRFDASEPDNSTSLRRPPPAVQLERSPEDISSVARRVAGKQVSPSGGALAAPGSRWGSH
eukprot:scaffold1724_cov246-Pinguiococcus_pyrenoidosus.AAC.22